jgi:hypothetical protein
MYFWDVSTYWCNICVLGTLTLIGVIYVFWDVNAYWCNIWVFGTLTLTSVIYVFRER